MDFREIIAQHIETGADITIATIPVGPRRRRNRSASCKSPTTAASRASSKNPRTRRAGFVEALAGMQAKLGRQDGANPFSPRWASTFSTASSSANCSTIRSPISASTSSRTPSTRTAFSPTSFQGYWEDIGTIRSFFEANLDLVTELPRFNFFDMSAPDLFSRPRYLPGSKINGAQIDHAVISDGCIINRARITNTIVGLRTIVGAGTELNRVIILGSDYYESQESVQRHTSARASRASASARTARSKTPSLTRTRASATT
jgi:glucose-1-phosphate adenylyltransferase